MAGCCPPGSLPELVANHEDQGIEVDVPGLDMKLYVVGEGDIVILHFYDIFGFKGGRTRYLCDEMAKQGYKVVIPDYFRGDSAKPEFFANPGQLLMPWLKKFSPEKVVSDTEKVVEFLKSHHGAKHFGGSSTCWGSWVLFHCCAKGLPIEVGVNYHPSLKNENLFGSAPEVLAKDITQPQLLLPAGNDPDNIKQGGAVIKILKDNNDKSDCKEYPNQKHGFMCRADDLSNPETIKDINDATEKAYKFLADYFKCTTHL